LLHHFGSRDALLVAVLKNFDERGGPSATPLRSMRDVLEYIVASVPRRPGLARMSAILAAQASDPAHEAHAYFRDRYAMVRRFLSRELVREIEAGTVAAGIDPDQAALQIVGLVEGLQLQWLIDPTIDLEAALRAAFDAALSAVALASD
jgi:AcrR family transcriptional regulator